MATSSSSSYAVDPSVWRAVAGASVRIPSVNSHVYYFPEGHIEHSPISAAASLQNHNVALGRPFILCQVLSVRFLSNISSDQVFVKILLQPLHPCAMRPRRNSESDPYSQNDVVVFAKILTPSDANNGGGFSVPRFCADSIFPPLDFAADPPVQNLTMKDTHNNAWEFRHIYRGTPRRHLLTTGWSKFVNGKRLVAGDSVVFMRRKTTDELFLGIRRAVRFTGPTGWESVQNSSDGDGSEVLKAIENAAKGTAFEVVYYPRVGMPDFVVSAEKVEDSYRQCWSRGMRVRMPVETEDSSRMTWFQGTIAAVTSPDSGPWRGSPWRMLQVTWDDPEILQNMNRVSPWQLEEAVSSQPLDSPFPPTKKLRVYQNQGTLLNGEETQFVFPMAAAHLNSSLYNYSPLPGGMQGARRNNNSIPNIPSSLDDNYHQTFTELLINESEPELKTVSTVLNIGSSHSENQSPGSQGSVHFGGGDVFGQVGQNPSGGGSFQLFGKIIEVTEAVGGGSGANSERVPAE